MEEYEPIRVLGEGAFGKVYLMRQRTQRTLMCVKVIKIKNIPKKEREACRSEVRADLRARARAAQRVTPRARFRRGLWGGCRRGCRSSCCGG